MAAVDKFEITIKGKGGHGAHPQDTVDSIVIGSDVSVLQKVVSRKVDPLACRCHYRHFSGRQCV